MSTIRSKSLSYSAFVVIAVLFSLLPASGESIYPTTPFISPQGGTYRTGKTVRITDGTPGTTIHYTLDGSIPSISSPVLTGTISIPTKQATVVVQAIAENGLYASAVATSTFTIVPTEPMLVFSIPGGTYYFPQTLALSSSAPGATIHYTTDGSTPSVNSPVYSGSIDVSKTMPISAFVEGTSDYAASAVVKQSYYLNLTVRQPVITPKNGTYNVSSLQVSLTEATPGATIYYTSDGTPATTSSTKYTGPFTITQTTTVNAMAVAEGYGDGAPIQGWLGINAPTPIISPPSGSYTTAQTFTISNRNAVDWVFYTTDGSTPTNSSPMYRNPVSLKGPGNWDFKVLAVKAGYQPSVIAESVVSQSLSTDAIASAGVLSSATESIAPDYLGLSHAWGSAQTLMGSSSVGVNETYRQFLTNLSDNMKGPVSIRILNDTSGATVDSTTLQPLSELAQANNVRYILGVNLAANNLTLAENQAKSMMASDAAPYIDALEIGNEPDLYEDGRRPSDYAWPDYLPQYQQWTAGITETTPVPVSFAGPAIDGYWVPFLEPSLVSGDFKAAIITDHEYVACYYPDSPLATDILLQPKSATIGGWFLAPLAQIAHTANTKLRAGEMNSVCRGGQTGVSDTFSSALWVIDTLFQYASYGLDGVNINTQWGGPYDLFVYNIVNWKGVITYNLKQVRPIYYGLLLFSRAAGNGAQLLNTSTLSDYNIKTWITKDRTGNAHLVIINKERSQSGTVEINLPGYSSGTVTQLTASDYTATSGVTFGGQTFDGTVDGKLLGSLKTQTVTPSGSVWKINMQPMSAVLVDLQ